MLNDNTNRKRLSRTSIRKEKKKKRKIIIIFLAFMLISLATITGYASYKLNEFFNKTSEPNVNKNPNEQIHNEQPTQIDEQIKFEDQSHAILLFGEDYRPETGSRNTDAIIVSIINPETNKITLLSIPRDTKVEIPGYGESKINSAYAYGEHLRIEQINNGEEPTIDGATLMMEVLSDLLEIPIEYYAKVDFKGFELIIDKLGGIEIDVDRDMVYYSEKDNTNINLQKGLQILNGKESLDYARFRRSSDGNDSSDFERNERHQKIIKAFVDEIATFNGATKIFDILEITGDHTKTNFTPEQMKVLLWEYKGITADDVISLKMDSYWKNPYVHIEEEELLRIQEELNNAMDIKSE